MTSSGGPRQPNYQVAACVTSMMPKKRHNNRNTVSRGSFTLPRRPDAKRWPRGSLNSCRGWDVVFPPHVPIQEYLGHAASAGIAPGMGAKHVRRGMKAQIPEKIHFPSEDALAHSRVDSIYSDEQVGRTRLPS